MEGWTSVVSLVLVLMLVSKILSPGLLDCSPQDRLASKTPYFFYKKKKKKKKILKMNLANRKGPIIILWVWFLGVTNECYLQFGYIVLTTSAGIMDHEEARRKNVGGKVLGFFY